MTKSFFYAIIVSVVRTAYAPVAQLDRVTDYESVGRRFESCRTYIKRNAYGVPLFSLFYAKQRWFSALNECRKPPLFYPIFFVTTTNLSSLELYEQVDKVSSVSPYAAVSFVSYNESSLTLVT